MSEKKCESRGWPNPLAELYWQATSEAGDLRVDLKKVYRTVSGFQVTGLKPSGDAFVGEAILKDGSHKKTFWHKNGRVLNTGSLTDWDLCEVREDRK